MTRLVRRGRAEAAVAFFERHAATVLAHLSEPQRTLLDALMEYADTMVELAAVRQEWPERRPEQPKPAATTGQKV